MSINRKNEIKFPPGTYPAELLQCVSDWIAEAEARGRAEERAAIVADLRAEAVSCRLNPTIDYPRDMTLDELADSYERGEHLEKKHEND